MDVRERGPGSNYGQFSTALLERDLQAIRSLYNSNGYLDAVISGQLLEGRQGGTNDLTVRIDIEEGVPTIVAGLVTSGFENFPVSEAVFNFASAPGRAFSEANVASDRQRILSEYFNQGYVRVAFNWHAEEGRSPREVLLHYDIDEGEPVRTGEVFLSGSRRTREDVIARGNDLSPGGPLSQSSMFSTQRNLYDLGVFSKVEVAVQNPDGIEEYKNVLVQVEEARRWAVGVGGGAEFARIGRNTAELTNPAGDATFSPPRDARNDSPERAGQGAHDGLPHAALPPAAARAVHLRGPSLVRFGPMADDHQRSLRHLPQRQHLHGTTPRGRIPADSAGERQNHGVVPLCLPADVY